MKIKKMVKKEVVKFDKSINDLVERRKDWKIFSERTLDIIKEIVNECKILKFYDSLIFGDENFIPNQNVINESFIFLSVGSHPIGIKKDVINPEKKEYKSELITEKGAQLVFSQSARGEVFIFIHPSESSVLKMTDGNLFFKYYKNPSKIDDKKILKSIKVFFWYNYISSCLGNISLMDRIYLFILHKKYKKIIKKAASVLPAVTKIITTLIPLL
jgi:hypothetical protein